MIQEFFKNELQTAYPEIEWSIDYYESENDVGVVYNESPEPSSTADDTLKFPNYMVLVRLKDWYKAELVAYDVDRRFNKRLKESFTTQDGRTYTILFVETKSGPLRLGVTDGFMQYTINFKATIKEE